MCENAEVRLFYKAEEEKRKSYEWQNNPHKDSGVDLYCPTDMIINNGETLFIKFGIKCALYRKGGPPVADGSDLQWKPCGFYLMPRSSISKTSSTGFLFSRKLRYTFAIFRSSVTETFVTVNRPASGINTSEINKLASICRISSPTLSGRLYGLWE